jgi:hypothetical protein
LKIFPTQYCAAQYCAAQYRVRHHLLYSKPAATVWRGKSGAFPEVQAVVSCISVAGLSHELGWPETPVRDIEGK